MFNQFVGDPDPIRTGNRNLGGFGFVQLAYGITKLFTFQLFATRAEMVLIHPSLFNMTTGAECL